MKLPGVNDASEYSDTMVRHPCAGGERWKCNQPLTFADEVEAIPGGEHLEMCYSCGTCVSKCMIQQKLEPEYNPRRLLRMVMMDMRKKLLQPHNLAVLCL